MSIQDDYYELSAELEGPLLEKFERIWQWGCENERENDKLRPIVYGLKRSIEAMFTEDKFLEER